MASAENEPLRVGTLWVVEKDDPLPVLRPQIEVSFREAAQADSPYLAAATVAVGGISAPQVGLAEINRRLVSGRRCFAGWAAGEIAVYGWVSFDEEYVGELDLRLRLLPSEAYVWDCATLPAFRRNGLFSALLVFMAAQLRAEGIQGVWIGADLDNAPSQRGIDRAGCRRVADLLVKRGEPARQGWLEGYPGAPEALVAGAQRVLLGSSAHARSSV